MRTARRVEIGVGRVVALKHRSQRAARIGRRVGGGGSGGDRPVSALMVVVVVGVVVEWQSS